MISRPMVCKDITGLQFARFNAKFDLLGCVACNFIFHQTILQFFPINLARLIVQVSPTFSIGPV